MKIIVMNSADLRVEVLNVPEHMLDEGVETFLAEHDYSLNNITWMAAPIDFVPVQFHEYGICHSDGEELHFVRQGKLIAIIHLLATKSELFGKFLLLTVLHLLHTVIDREGG